MCGDSWTRIQHVELELLGSGAMLNRMHNLSHPQAQACKERSTIYFTSAS